MKFDDLTVRKIRFIMAGSRKYRQNVWHFLRYIFPVLMGSISIFVLLKDDFGIDVCTYNKNT